MSDNNRWLLLTMMFKQWTHKTRFRNQKQNNKKFHTLLIFDLTLVNAFIVTRIYTAPLNATRGILSIDLCFDIHRKKPSQINI